MDEALVTTREPEMVSDQASANGMYGNETTASSTVNENNGGPSNLSRANGNNVSVTNINCPDELHKKDDMIVTNDDNKMYCAMNSNDTGGIRIRVPKMENSDDESDSELTNIEKSVAQNSLVNMRNHDVQKYNGPRPMSWEGELSESEDLMDVENSSSLSHAIDLQQHNSKMENTSEQFQVIPSDEQTLMTDKDIKPEFDNPGLESSVGRDIDTYTTQSYEAELDLSTKSSAIDSNTIVNLKNEPDINLLSGNSPLLARAKQPPAGSLLPANPSPDSAIHSVYTHSSPSQSPLTTRHAPYTPSLSRNNSDASYSSCYSYSSEFSPTHSPIQGRHTMYGATTLHQSVLNRPMIETNGTVEQKPPTFGTSEDNIDNDAIPAAGISRQQLINSPCPICGDKISGFHYGIFSCESCKGFFKRTVQNRKNYVCLRGAICPVTVATRKKCPACRFEKCLQRGMKLEAIREDRTRGGRSTYQCSYTLPNSMMMGGMTGSVSTNNLMISGADGNGYQYSRNQMANGMNVKMENFDNNSSNSSMSTPSVSAPSVPPLLQEIMDVEHLWQYTDNDLNRLNQISSSSSAAPSSNPLLASAGLSSENFNPDLIANLCNVADTRLYKIVKWCKSLPLFKNISIDDQICLLINSWCELLLFSCCFRSVSSPGEIRVSLGKTITLSQAKSSGLHACIERMLHLTDHLRRLRVDRYEYVAMKVIVLLQSDTSELKEPEKVRASQEKALQALQAYTLAHYPDSPAKFGELLLRIPELQRTCQVGKEMLTIKAKEGEEFNLLMELLRGEH